MSDQARADLIHIWVYVAKDSPATADAFATQIFERCRLLANNPALGRGPPELGIGLDSFPYKSDVIDSRQREDRLEIARASSAHRDLEARF